MQCKHAFSTLQVKIGEGWLVVYYDSTHVMFPSVNILCATSGGIYVLSLLVDDTMSRPSNISSSVSRLDRSCRGIKYVILDAAAAAALLSSPLSSSSFSLSVVVVCAGVCLGAGVGVGGGVQWLLRRTARPVLSDSLNASRVLRRRIYNIE